MTGRHPNTTTIHGKMLRQHLTNTGIDININLEHTLPNEILYSLQCSQKKKKHYKENKIKHAKTEHTEQNSKYRARTYITE